MHVTVKLSLKLEKSQKYELLNYEKSMYNEISRIYEVFKKEERVYDYPFREISNVISWHSKGLILHQAKKLFYNAKNKKKISFPFSSIWSEKSYEISNDTIRIELGRNTQSRKMYLLFYVHAQQQYRLAQGEHKELTIIRNKEHWYAYILVEINKIERLYSDKKMGIDVGVKNPAVVYTQDGKVKFFGNGRERAYVQRRYRKHIQKMQEYKQIEQLKDFEHKLHRKLTFYDHQTSKEIIKFAIENEIGIIVMERLTNISKSFHIEITKDIYLWSYRRIQNYIAYKAALAGIKVEYVNPCNTSKRCPICGLLNKPKDRLYMCSCGFHSHRDIVGARNIMLAL